MHFSSFWHPTQIPILFKFVFSSYLCLSSTVHLCFVAYIRSDSWLLLRKVALIIYDFVSSQEGTNPGRLAIIQRTHYEQGNILAIAGDVLSNDGDETSDRRSTTDSSGSKTLTTTTTLSSAFLGDHHEEQLPHHHRIAHGIRFRRVSSAPRKGNEISDSISGLCESLSA